MNIDSIWHSCPTTPLRGSPSSDISSSASSPFPHPTHSPMTKFNQCCYMCTSVGISTRVWTICPRIHCWRKLTLPLPKTCFMCFLSGDVNTSSARVGFHEPLSHPYWYFDWFGLAQVLCRQPQWLWVCDGMVLSYPEGIALQQFSQTSDSSSSPYLFCSKPWGRGGGGCNIDAPVLIEYSTDTYSLHFG